MSATTLPKGADFALQNEGSIFLLLPRNKAAKAWLTENVGGEVQTFGGAIAVEHRYIADLVAGIQSNGFTVV